MRAKTRISLAVTLWLAGCQGASAPEVAATVDRLASADKTLATRTKTPTLAWTTEASGGVVSERVSKKLGKVSARLAKTADGEWEVALGAVHRVALKPVNARASALEIEGKRAIYRDAYPSTDLVFTSSTQFAEQFLVLRDAKAPKSFAWDLRIPGVQLAVQPSDFGAFDFIDAKNRPILRMPRPVAVDSAGRRREGSLDWDGRQFVVGIETAGLSYPILLDPVIETVGWVREPLLGARSFGPGMVTLGSTVVLFGGDAALDERVWTFDGTAWSAKLTSPRPSARLYPAMATLNDKVVLFGGYDPVQNTVLDDTWEWDGVKWTKRNPVTSPPARAWSAMTALGDKVVLFGGGAGRGNFYEGDQGFADTWEWDGNDWTQKHPTTSPPEIQNHVLGTFDSKVVLFGGDNGWTDGSIWEWDGSNWTKLHATSEVCGEIIRTLLATLNGRLQIMCNRDGFIQEWDGNTLTTTAVSPFPAGALTALAGLGGRIIGTGNIGDCNNARNPGTWAFDGTNWSQILGPDTPPTCYAPDFAEYSDQAYAFCADWGWSSEAWKWGGATWQVVPRGGLPYTPVSPSGMASNSNKLVMVAGVDTWEFDGTGWHQASPVTSPPLCYNCGCVASINNDVALLVGGDVWRYDGTTWAVTQSSPAPTICDSMAGVGGDLFVFAGETWQFDGTTWTELSTSTTVGGHCLLTKQGATALIMYCSEGQTWELDGSTWNQVPASLASPVFNTYLPGLASIGGVPTLFGGMQEPLQVPLDATWSYRSVHAPGSNCTDGSECVGEHCVNGYCCDTACDLPCEACDVAGHEGACTLISGSPRDANACLGGTTCGGSCDGKSANCTFPDSSITCRAASCTNGVATMAASCDGAGHCPEETTQDCAPYLCGGSLCAGNCQVDANCAPGFYCPAGLCVAKGALGAVCKSTRKCTSGFCADGVCCDSGCLGRCEACDIHGKAGTCTPVAGAPHGSRKACLSDGTVCGGVCDGKLTTACRYPSAQIGCRAASCSNDVATISASCDGAGSCPTLETQSCGPYHCAATICAGNCGKDSDCGAGYFCPAGICRPTGALGVKCAAARDCASGHCADGVCCDSECAGQCEACNQFGQGGACKPVVGVPLGVRATCIGSGTCAATCDGVHPNECTPPDAHTLCRAASCGFGVATAAAYCNGSGSCPEVSTLSCEPYACAGSDCADLCKGNGDCAAGYTCSEGACVKEADTGASCTADAKCTSGHCVDGVCCESACVSQCSACDVAGSLGHCVAVEGAAHGARAQCAAGSQCQGGICATVSGGTSGCGCSSSAGAMPAFGLLMLFSLAVGRRRRWR